MASDYSMKPAILNNEDNSNGQYHLYFDLTDDEMLDWFHFLHGSEPEIESEVKLTRTEDTKITEIDDQKAIQLVDRVAQTTAIVVDAPVDAMSIKKKKKKKRCTIQ